MFSAGTIRIQNGKIYIFILNLIVFSCVSDIYYKSDGMPERLFRGKLRVIDGDTYTPELADQSSLRFQHKAKFYQDGIDAIINHSDLKAGFQKCEVLALDGYVLSITAPIMKSSYH